MNAKQKRPSFRRPLLFCHGKKDLWHHRTSLVAPGHLQKDRFNSSCRCRERTGSFRPSISSPPASPPCAAPASSPSTPSVNQPDEQEKQHCAKRGCNDFRDDARTEMDPRLRKYPARNEGPYYSHDEIADQAQPCTLDDLAREPASSDADSQYDEKSFA